MGTSFGLSKEGTWHCGQISRSRGQLQAGGVWTSSLENNKHRCQGIPGGPVEKDQPANAGDAGSIPCPGGSCILQSLREPRLLQRLGSTASEAQDPPRVCTPQQETPRRREVHNESPHSLKLGKACKDQCSQNKDRKKYRCIFHGVFFLPSIF